MGLIFNTYKCELIAHQGVLVSDKLLQLFTRIDQWHYYACCVLFLLLCCLLDQCSTVFGLIVVMTSQEQLARCIICALKMHCSCLGRLSVHQKFFTSCGAHFRLLTYLSINSIWRWDQLCNTSPTVICQTYSGFRPVYQLRIVAWGDTCVFARI